MTECSTLRAIRCLRLDAERFVDAWTRPSASELSVGAGVKEDHIEGESPVRLFLALFLARLFRDKEEITRIRGALPPSLAEIDELFDVSTWPISKAPWSRVRGVALNVWMPRGLESEARSIRIFKDFRRRDSGIEARARLLGRSLPATAQALWQVIALRPYFALTRALGSSSLHTIISFLAAHEEHLRSDFVLGLDFRQGSRRAITGHIGVPASVLELPHGNRPDLGRLYRRLEVDVDAAAVEYLQQRFQAGVLDTQFAERLERRIAASGMLEFVREIASAISTCIFAPKAAAGLSAAQTLVMLALLRDFYLVSPRCSHFYVLPVFHTSKPGQSTRMRTLSTIGITSTGPLSDAVLEGLQTAFHTLVSPLQLGDLTIREEARAIQGRAHRYAVLIHQVKNDLMDITKLSTRYDQVLELLQSPKLLAAVEARIGDPRELARESEALDRKLKDISDEMEAVLSYDMNSQTTIDASLAYLKRRMPPEMTVSIAPVPEAVRDKPLRGSYAGLALHMLEIVTNAHEAGLKTQRDFSISLEVGIEYKESAPARLPVQVKDTCGGMPNGTQLSGIAYVRRELETMGGLLTVASVAGAGTTVTLLFPIVEEETAHVADARA